MAAVEQLEDRLGGLELAQRGPRGDLSQRAHSVGKGDDLAGARNLDAAVELLAGPARSRVGTRDASAEPLHLVHPAQPVEKQRLGVDPRRDREHGAIEIAEEEELSPASDEEGEEDFDHLNAQGAGQILAGEDAALDEDLADAADAAARSGLGLERAGQLFPVEHPASGEDLAESLGRAARESPGDVAVVEHHSALDAFASSVEDAAQPPLVEEVEQVGGGDVREVAEQHHLAGGQAPHLRDETALACPHGPEKVVEPSHVPISARAWPVSALLLLRLAPVVDEGLVLLPLELVLDGALQEEGLCRQDMLPSVDEDGGSRLDACRLALAFLGIDHRVVLARVDLLEHLGAVEADLLRISLERIVLELLLMGEERLVHLPELALVPRVLGAAGGDLRAGMARQREVLRTQACKSPPAAPSTRDRKSTRLNSSHLVISYAVF